MGRLLKGVVLSAMAAGAVVYLYAQRRSAETGRDMGAVLSNLPAELKESGDALKQHMEEAASAGRKAAIEREDEIERQLSGEEDAQVQIKDYVA